MEKPDIIKFTEDRPEGVKGIACSYGAFRRAWLWFYLQETGKLPDENAVFPGMIPYDGTKIVRIPGVMPKNMPGFDTGAPSFVYVYNKE